MTRKRSKKKTNEILRLKLLFEEKDVVKDELDIGTLELDEILREFSKTVNPDQAKSFNRFFFGADEISMNKNSVSPEAFELSKDIKGSDSGINKKKESPKWVKDTYKKVVQRTHPDRYIDFPILEIKKKFTDIYIRAVSAFESGDVGLLLLCAYEVEVKVDDPRADEYIQASIDSQIKEIKQSKGKLGYQWYHLPDENRIIFLENYLKQLGYNFEKTKAEDIVRRKVYKRKVGTKPIKVRVNRKKIN